MFPANMARGRGRGMGRGGVGVGRGGAVVGGVIPPFKIQKFVPRHPFDTVLCEPAFPRVKPAVNDEAFTQVSSCYYIFSSNYDTSK